MFYNINLKSYIIVYKIEKGKYLFLDINNYNFETIDLKESKDWVIIDTKPLFCNISKQIKKKDNLFRFMFDKYDIKNIMLNMNFKKYERITDKHKTAYIITLSKQIGLTISNTLIHKMENNIGKYNFYIPFTHSYYDKEYQSRFRYDYLSKEYIKQTRNYV